MPNVDIFEGEKWIIKGKHKKGPTKDATVKLSIKKVAKDGAETEVHSKADIKLDDSKEFAYPYSTEKVGEKDPFFKLVADVEYGKAPKQRLAGTCTVWPKQCAVIAKDANDKPYAGFEFTAKQGDKLPAPAPTDKDGKSVVSLNKTDKAVKFTGSAPFEVIEQKTSPDKLREVTLKVRRNFEPVFVKPTVKEDKKPIQQFVNLTTGANGQDEKGHEVLIEVGEKPDANGKKGKKDDIIYIQVKFGRHSERNAPKPQIAAGEDATDIAEADAGKTYTAKVTLKADDGTAKFKLDLGRAGGDTCEVRLSSTKDSFTAPPLKFENWRRIYYQLSLPAGASTPDLKRITKALKDVNIVYEKYKTLTFAEGSGPAGTAVSWFPGEWLADTYSGKKLLNLGDYNKAHFHTKFSDDKNPVETHVACCHTQYDASGAGCLKNFLNLEVSANNKVTWSDGTKVIGLDVWVGGGLFPKFLKDGSSGFVSGSWAEAGGAHTGPLAAADVWIHNGKKLGMLTIKVPDPAKALLTATAGKKVKLTFAVKSAAGAYLGESDGTSGWLQLIVIEQPPNVVNDVLAHELGHTLNQVTKVVPPGMSAAKHGRKYTGNGHQGPHCADGMSADNYAGGAGKAGSSYQGNFAGKSECTCIMYGENGKGSKCTGKFCTRCKPFLKGEALDTLH
jgi:hypothetical protein